MSRSVRTDYEALRERQARAQESMVPATEWGTDHWGEVLSEPNEEHARSVAAAGGSNLYSRPPMGAWTKESA